MSHEISVNVSEWDADVELDYEDVWMNIEEAVTEAAQNVAQNVVDERAWDTVEYQVYDAAEDAAKNARGEVGLEIEQYLVEFLKADKPCVMGEVFIKAVQKALTWDGKEFGEVPSSVNPVAIDYAWLQEAISKEITVQLKKSVSSIKLEIHDN